MPWPQKYRLRAGSVQTGAAATTQARRVNRHARAHVNDVVLQALRLHKQEQIMLEEHWSSTEYPPLQPLRGVRRAGESDPAVMACNDYLRMPGRSLLSYAHNGSTILRLA